MNDTQHKSGIVKVLQRYRDSDFLQKSVPPITGLDLQNDKTGSLQPYSETEFEKIRTIEDKT